MKFITSFIWLSLPVTTHTLKHQEKLTKHFEANHQSFASMRKFLLQSIYHQTFVTPQTFGNFRETKTLLEDLLFTYLKDVLDENILLFIFFKPTYEK